MSQQKNIVLVAACVFGLVAIVSAQSFDMDSCQKSLRKNFEQYVSSMRQSSNKFVSDVQQMSEGAMDTSRFQDDIDKLVNSMNQLMNQGTNFDAGRVASAYLDNMRTVQSMMSNAFRLYAKMPQSAMTTYFEFFQSAMSAQSKLMTAIASSCSPANRSSNSQ